MGYLNGIFTDADGQQWEHLTDADRTNLRSIKFNVVYDGESGLVDSLDALNDLFLNTSHGFDAYKLYSTFHYTKLDVNNLDVLEREFYNGLINSGVIVDNYCIRQNPVSSLEQLVKRLN